MRVGDYVRTHKGHIARIVKITDATITCDKTVYPMKNYGYEKRIYKENIKRLGVKSSPNIIDLIEVGDYVNGKKVIKVWEEPFGEFAGQIFTILEGEETAPTIREIKSIVTKEQIERMEYKIND